IPRSLPFCSRSWRSMRSRRTFFSPSAARAGSAPFWRISWRSCSLLRLNSERVMTSLLMRAMIFSTTWSAAMAVTAKTATRMGSARNFFIGKSDFRGPGRALPRARLGYGMLPDILHRSNHRQDGPVGVPRLPVPQGNARHRKLGEEAVGGRQHRLANVVGRSAVVAYGRCAEAGHAEFASAGAHFH